ncbi:polysaccharide biosynthesis/export family protein [uncultured Thiohalocapsa sp.]|uniref:polysaccharide biosynthesis/export family protein n=1 Tax=uncultured Thiohalocapsa sp. TaxID=768990 RepID=UPI0025F901F7|nr:polysaccharide biosynthesis/export family protein [uncultured Thiohalocapsa sp.]
MSLLLLACAVSACAPSQQRVLPPDVDQPPPMLRPEAFKAPPQQMTRRLTTEEQLAELRRLEAETRVAPTLGKGDILSVSVYDEPDLSVTGVPIRPDGRISFPLIGDVQAAGRSVDALADAITERLARFVIAPRVSVIVTELNSLNYTINGEVTKPGVYPLVTDVSLTQAVARAGGFKKGQFRSSSVEVADLSTAFIARQGQVLPVDFTRLFRQGDLRFDIELQDGDYISIPSGLSKEVYIVGEVNKPAQFAFREAMPMSRSLALAEGFTREADLSRVHIVRGALSNPQLIVVNFRDVLNGRAQDVQLEPNDIVYVPPTYLSQWAQMLNQIVPTITAIQTGIILSNSVGSSDDG